MSDIDRVLEAADALVFFKAALRNAAYGLACDRGGSTIGYMMELLSEAGMDKERAYKTACVIQTHYREARRSLSQAEVCETCGGTREEPGHRHGMTGAWHEAHQHVVFPDAETNAIHCRDTFHATPAVTQAEVCPTCGGPREEPGSILCAACPTQVPGPCLHPCPPCPDTFHTTPAVTHDTRAEEGPQQAFNDDGSCHCYCYRPTAPPQPGGSYLKADLVCVFCGKPHPLSPPTHEPDTHEGERK